MIANHEYSRGWVQFLALSVVAGSAAIARAEETAPESKQVPAGKPASVSVPKDSFAEQIERAIQVTSQRRLTAGVHTPWQVVHGILAQRWDLRMLKKDNSKEEVHAIEWITSGVYFDGEPLWEATPYGGRGHPYTRPYAFEGHPTQFMGYMTMANIPLEYEVRTPTKIVTIGDIVKDAKMQVHSGVEITWTLWTLSHYEEPDAQWFNAAGEPWSIERLVKMQIDEPVTSGACGGCHGLFALAYARNMYLSWEPKERARHRCSAASGWKPTRKSNDISSRRGPCRTRTGHFRPSTSEAPVTATISSPASPRRAISWNG